MDSVHDYGWQTDAAPCSSNYITPHVLRILQRLPARRVADLGSGNGQLCSILEQQGFETVGVECDRQGFEIAKRAYPRIAFYNLGVQSDPAELLRHEHKFDCVVSTEVIEHLYSPHLLPMFASKILNDGGYLIISTPYHGYLKNLLLAIVGHWENHHTPLWHGGHIKFWSRNTLRRLLENNGFKYISFTGAGRAPLVWKSMIILAQKH
jgi:2-polyprenyl-3-methyl-5-hydroxy-6-metoxy-1,4-benzoquinol methylase